MCLLLLLIAVVLRTAWVSDDAFITFRTVDNVLNGYGLRWNVAERVQSYTHPLWMLLLLPAVALVGSPYLASLLVSFALTALTVTLLVVPARERPWSVAFGLTVLLFSKAFVDYSTSGLENPLSHALLAGLMVTAARDRRSTDRHAGHWRGVPGAGWRMPGATHAHALLLGLLVALIGLSRMDLLLIAGPIALTTAVCGLKLGGRASVLDRASFRMRSLALFILGASPLVAWTLFSIAYYGVPFPNTAYAKLATGVPPEMLAAQGLRYLGESLDRDPVTLPVIAAGMLVPVAFLVARVVSRRAARQGVGAPAPGSAGLSSPRIPPYVLAVASASLLLYLTYVVRIGGDFMSGRFLAAPLVVAVFTLQQLPWPGRPLPGLALVLAVAGVGLSSREPSVVLLTGPSTQTFEEIWRPHGVVDERSFYFDRTAFITRGGFRTAPDQKDLRSVVADLRNQHPRTIVFQTVGMTGYYVGPDRHIIDTLALCDPLLARLPAIPPWRIGHYQRALPEGYFESVDTDRNLVHDSEIAALYDQIRLATRGPLWTWERWRAIWELNIG